MIRIGTLVRLKGKKETARVIEKSDDIKGGVKLDRPLADYQWWKVKDLERAESSKRC